MHKFLSGQQQRDMVIVAITSPGVLHCRIPTASETE